MRIEKLIEVIDKRSKEQPQNICFSEQKMKEIGFAMHETN